MRGIILLAESGHHDPVNIGNPNEFTLLELAEAVIEITGSESKIVYEELPTDDPQVRQPDITKARELLGWEPEVQLREGLEQTIERAGREALVGVRHRLSRTPMPPTDRFVISFAAEPPQQSLPYGRWAELLREHFVAACEDIDSDGEEIGAPGDIRWFPDRTLVRPHVCAGASRGPRSATRSSATCPTWMPARRSGLTRSRHAPISPVTSPKPTTTGSSTSTRWCSPPGVAKPATSRR